MWQVSFPHVPVSLLSVYSVVVIDNIHLNGVISHGCFEFTLNHFIHLPAIFRSSKMSTPSVYLLICFDETLILTIWWIVHKYFLSSYRLSLHSVDCFLGGAKAFQFDVICQLFGLLLMILGYKNQTNKKAKQTKSVSQINVLKCFFVYRLSVSSDWSSLICIWEERSFST